MNVLIVGSGAHGGWVGSRLIQAGIGVSYLVGSPQRMSELDRHGLVVRSPNGLFHCRVHAKVYTEISHAYDFVIFASRAQNASLARAAARPAVGPTTIVLPLSFDLLQIQLLLEDGYGVPVGAVPNMAVTQERDGSIKHWGGSTGLRLGTLNPSSEQSLRPVQELFRPSEIDAAVSHRIRSEIWIEFVRNAALAALAALVPGSLTEAMSHSRGKILFRELFREGISVGSAMNLSIESTQCTARLESSIQRKDIEQFESNGSARAESRHNLMVLLRQLQDFKVRVPNLEKAYAAQNGDYPNPRSGSVRTS